MVIRASFASLLNEGCNFALCWFGFNPILTGIEIRLIISRPDVLRIYAHLEL